LITNFTAQVEINLFLFELLKIIINEKGKILEPINAKKKYSTSSLKLFDQITDLNMEP